MRRLVVFVGVAGGVAYGLGMLARKLAPDDQALLIALSIVVIVIGRFFVRKMFGRSD
jgi:hypothetical protein